MNYIYVLVRTCLGGLSNNISKLVINDLPMYHFLILRYFLGIILSLSKTKNLKTDLLKTAKEKKLLLMVISTVLMSVSASVLFYKALILLPVSIVSSLNNSMVILATTLVGFTLFYDRRQKSYYVWLSMLLPASFLVVYNGESTFENISITGLGFLGLAALLQALESYISKKVVNKISVLSTNFLKTFFCLIAAIVFTLIEGKSLIDSIQGMDVLLWFLVIYSAVNSLLISVLHLKSFKEIGVSITTIFTSLTPIFSAVFAMLIFGESLEISQWLGMIITIIILYFIPKKKK